MLQEENSMAFPQSLNITEQCQISPPSGSVLPVSIPLTIFDIIWLPMHPVERLFFFEHHCSINQFRNAILPDIKHSLSIALQHFFPLAGNLTWPEDSSRPEIHYKDGDSVSFTVAESDYDFDVLVCNDGIDVSAFALLVPQLINSAAEKHFPLTSFKVTLFPEKGISVGITYNHVVADGRSILHFIKTWAYICKNLQGVNSSTIDAVRQLPPPCISKSLVKEELKDETDSVVSNYLKKTNCTRDTFYTRNNHLPGTDKVFSTFVIGRADINKLKQCVLATTEENAPPLNLSTFVLTVAYFWVCSIKAQCLESVAVEINKDEMVHLVFPVDCRARLEPPLPVSYFGCCLTPVMVEAKISELMEENGISAAAELIGKGIRELENGNALMTKIQSMLSSFAAPSRILGVAGSPKFGAYDTDFGWGKPKKSLIVSIAITGAISLSECPSEIGAVEVGLALEKEEMDTFISLYTSTMRSCPLV